MLTSTFRVLEPPYKAGDIRMFGTRANQDIILSKILNPDFRSKYVLRRESCFCRPLKMIKCTFDAIVKFPLIYWRFMLTHLCEPFSVQATKPEQRVSCKHCARRDGSDYICQLHIARSRDQRFYVLAYRTFCRHFCIIIVSARRWFVHKPIIFKHVLNVNRFRY